MTSKYLIYGLFDPESGELRYIGQSSRGFKRPQEHFRPSGIRRASPRLANWMRKLQMHGLKPEIRAIAEHEQAETLDDAEVFAIAYYRHLGYDLVNWSEGGQTPMRGRRHAVETRMKIGAAHRGRKHSTEWNANSAAARRGKTLGELTKLKMRVSHTEMQGRAIVDQNGFIYPSLREAARTLGVTSGDVRNALKGRQAHVHGYRFSYLRSP